MYYLIYFAYESFPFKKEDLEDLLKQAREKNANHQVTGKLLYVEGTFIQLLEGNEQAVKSIFSDIERDKRIIALKVVAEGPAMARHFPDWSMAYEKISLADINQLEQCEHEGVKDYLTNATPFRLIKLIASNPLL
ncbi:BLUF domain-containing protein [Pedobacter glucosidilyticus]|uniref:BLUF domain-containing protein n=1 Tax=Pedobacter glucosidilyticus TaxID=1122941 RepID=UPI0026EF1277|nr:BLUF domain-containing protein [Pedobacter glucosidilyticus]